MLGAASKVCCAKPEANIVPKPMPLACQGSKDVPHFECHEHGLERRVLYWNGMIATAAAAPLLSRER